MQQLPIDLPPTEAELFGFTTCDHTGELVKRKDAVIVTKHFGRHTEQLHFKSEAAANEYYLERLRRSGM